MKTRTKILAECPSCGEMVFFDKNPELGQFRICQFCEEKLEVIELDPILLDFPMEDEDYDGEFDYEDDDDNW